MGSVAGKDFVLYTGDGMRAIGCEGSCTLNVSTEEIIVTSKESGRATNREIGRYDWGVNVSGMVSIQSELNGAGTKLDPTEFIAYQLQGKKVVVKISYTDGTTTKYFIGKGIVTSCSFVGSADNFLLFDVEIKSDGALYATSNAVSQASYDGPVIYTYTATTTVASVVISELIGNSAVYAVVKNGVLDTFMRYTGIGAFLPEDVWIDYADGTVTFVTDAVNGDVYLFIYDPA
jgi:predicted secreted protein